MLVCLVLLGVSACSWVTPYRIDVRQGNYVTQEMLAQLKPGMSRDQVRFIMGSPLIVDVFHKDRWDYAYRFSPGYGPVERRVVSVLFEGDKLKALEGDVVASTGSPIPTEPATPRVVEIAPAKP